jgi:undecaprenyl-diphosphatase
MDLFSIIVLGLVQGISEWIPISSKTQVTLVYLRFLGGSPSLVIPILLYSHLGTLFAASIYFRKEIRAIFDEILSDPFNYKTYVIGKTGFIINALLFTGLVGLPILYIEKNILPSLNGASIFVLMGIGLILTGLLLFSQKKLQFRQSESVDWKDGVFTGLLQGLSTLPGVSRAGTTSTALIWRSFDSESAFQLSFLLSIPSVVMAEILFYFFSKTGNLPVIDGISLTISSFIFGYLSLDIILYFVKRINIAYLAMLLGALIMIAAYFQYG